jgi:ribosomal protein S18 acetylase RimI-like enzyme
MLAIVPADTKERIQQAADLFRQYATIPGIEVCLQSFDEEVKGLPGKYAPPAGRILLATNDGKAIGCIALHRLPDDACEIKRLFVKPEARGVGAGRRLAEAALVEAAKIGYRKIRLETLPEVMTQAVELYRVLGFEDSRPPENAKPGVLHMERAL